MLSVPVIEDDHAVSDCRSAVDHALGSDRVVEAPEFFSGIGIVASQFRTGSRVDPAVVIDG